MSVAGTDPVRGRSCSGSTSCRARSLGARAVVAVRSPASGGASQIGDPALPRASDMTHVRVSVAGAGRKPRGAPADSRSRFDRDDAAVREALRRGRDEGGRTDSRGLKEWFERGERLAALRTLLVLPVAIVGAFSALWFGVLLFLGSDYRLAIQDQGRGIVKAALRDEGQEFAVGAVRARTTEFFPTSHLKRGHRYVLTMTREDGSAVTCRIGPVHRDLDPIPKYVVVVVPIFPTDTAWVERPSKP
jgi:hypothetical protein